MQLTMHIILMSFLRYLFSFLASFQETLGCQHIPNCETTLKASLFLPSSGFCCFRDYPSAWESDELRDPETSTWWVLVWYQFCKIGIEFLGPGCIWQSESDVITNHKQAAQKGAARGDGRTWAQSAASELWWSGLQFFWLPKSHVSSLKCHEFKISPSFLLLVQLF